MIRFRRVGARAELGDVQQEACYQLWAADPAVIAKSPLLHSDNLLRFAGNRRISRNEKAPAVHRFPCTGGAGKRSLKDQTLG
jgi:hypothetical protein